MFLLKTPQNIDKSSQLYSVRTNGVLPVQKKTFGLKRLHAHAWHNGS